jgi:Ser-tRNA(Ala) deacylase AlaX
MGSTSKGSNQCPLKMEELTPELNYRFTIIEAINFLKQTRKELLVKLTNVAMSGEWNDVDSVFDEGDEIDFDSSYFKDCKDDNINALYRLIKVNDEIIDYLIERNNIQDNELGIRIIL